MKGRRAICQIALPHPILRRERSVDPTKQAIISSCYHHAIPRSIPPFVPSFPLSFNAMRYHAMPCYVDTHPTNKAVLSSIGLSLFTKNALLTALGGGPKTVRKLVGEKK